MQKAMFFLLTLLIFSNFSQAKERKLYTASNSTQAILEFDGKVEYETNRSPQERTLKKVVESQLEHIVGPMSMVDYTAVPKGDHIVSNLKIESHQGNIYVITYHYKGTIVVQNGPTDSYLVYLPVNPNTIYKRAMAGNHNPCTDAHYQSEGDFWYFWFPFRYGCKLKEGVDFYTVKGSLKRIDNQKLTYPEYQNLSDEKGYITIHMLFGMDDPTLSRNPLDSRDINAYNYREFRNYLLKNGYRSSVWNEKQIGAIAQTTNGSLPFVETIYKDKIAYRFFFGPTGIDEESLAFHWFFKDAIENGSIMVYEGHSGLGGHLDLDSIEYDLGTKIKFNTKRYQIFYFDSCTSYRYYNQMFFERKITTTDPKGTKKLDILTNGLSTTFDSMQTSATALHEAIEKSLQYATNNNAFVSYQTLAKQIDSGNLFGINGDEDNGAPQAIK
jgi:hypothetical protein